MAKIYFADGMDCELALQDGASVGDALATAAARLDVKKPHARFLALHAASATGAVEAAPLGRATALANGGRLVILVRLWTAGLRAAVEEDAALRDLAFRQARCCALGARARLRGRRALGGRRGHARVSRGGRHCRSRAVSARRRARVPDRGLGLVGRSRGVAVLHGEIRRRARVLRPRWIVCRRSAGRGLCGNQPVRRVRGRRDDSARTRRKI